MHQQRSCRHCNSELPISTRRRVYCNDSCRTAHHNKLKSLAAAKRRRIKRASKEKLFDKTAFAKYLASECRRAGTVEILAKHNGGTFLELLQTTRSRSTFNGTAPASGDYKYEISHIRPVQGKESIGLLHPQNIVICPKNYNRARRCTTSQTGLDVSRADLSNKFLVGPNESNRLVLQKIKAILGKETLNKFYDNAKLYLTQRDNLLEKVRMIDTGGINVNKLDTDELIAILNDNGISACRVPTRPTHNPIAVAFSELKRTNKTDSVLFLVIESLNSFETAAILREDINQAVFEAHVLDQAWNLLHGAAYSLFFNDWHLIECFDLVIDVEPITKLDQILVSRNTRLVKARFDYF